MKIWKKCVHCGNSQNVEVTNIPHNVARADYEWCVKCLPYDPGDFPPNKNFWGFRGYYDANGVPLNDKGRSMFFAAQHPCEAACGPETCDGTCDDCLARQGGTRNGSPVGKDGVIYRDRSGQTFKRPTPVEWAAPLSDAEALKAWHDKAMQLQRELDEARSERDRYIQRNSKLEENLANIRRIVK